MVLAAAVLALGATAGCKRSARTPEQAYARFADAVRASDAVKLYETLDLDTRWSWMTIRRAHREAYDIVLSNFPEGPERTQRGRRFEAAALAESEAALFASQLAPGRLAELNQGLPDKPALQAQGADQARVDLGSGKTLAFRKGQDGSWGFAGMAGEAEERKRRAAADLELIRINAADFERAAARAGE